MISKHYFFIQKLTFAAVGIDVMSKTPKHLVKYPVILYGLITFSCFHLIIAAHYVYANRRDFVEVTDTFPLLCELILCICKMLLFLRKGGEFLHLINEIHGLNLKAKHEETLIVRRENVKDHLLCSFYLRFVLFAGFSALLHPVFNVIYIYLTREEIVLEPPNKGTYFWNFNHLAGYSLVYILNIFTMYYVCFVSLTIDTLFSWFVSNVVARFHIIKYRFEKVALKLKKNKMIMDQASIIKPIILYHCQTLQLTEKLNHVYSEIIFIEFTIVCTEICSLVFRVNSPNESGGDVAYKCLFFTAVALQLILYCYNGQRISDESAQVAIDIYSIIDWTSLGRSYKNILLLTMVCSQKSIVIKSAFFKVDLTLYLWVFKTAASLFTALKTVHENQD